MKSLTTTVEQGGITYGKLQISFKSQFLQQKTSCKNIMKYYSSIKGKWGVGWVGNTQLIISVSVGKEHMLSFARNGSSGISQSALSVPAKL